MGKYILQLNKIKENGLIPVRRKRDILVARALSREEKRNIERGGPDIEVTTPSGAKRFVNRKELVEKYTYLDGKKINISGWSSSNEYVVARLDDTEALAMMVPKDCSAEVNGIIANSVKRSTGDYIVGLVDERGMLVEETIGIIPAAVFKKMYYIPPNEVIRRNKGKGNKLFLSARRNKGLNAHSNKKSGMGVGTGRPNPGVGKPGGIDFTKGLGLDVNNFDFGDRDESALGVADRTVAKTPVNKQPAGTVFNGTHSTPVEHNTSYKYAAIGRIENSENMTIGFVIQDKAGNTKKISKEQMFGLCKGRLVSNVMLGVRQETGKEYLRGNNTRLDMLPVYRM